MCRVFSNQDSVVDLRHFIEYALQMGVWGYSPSCIKGAKPWLKMILEHFTGLKRALIKACNTISYPPTKSEGYSFGVVRASVRPSILSVLPSVRPSVRTFCLSGTISQYLLVRFDSFLVQMISIMNSRYPISLVKIDPLTLELLPLF